MTDNNSIKFKGEDREILKKWQGSEKSKELNQKKKEELIDWAEKIDKSKEYTITRKDGSKTRGYKNPDLLLIRTARFALGKIGLEEEYEMCKFIGLDSDFPMTLDCVYAFLQDVLEISQMIPNVMTVKTVARYTQISENHYNEYLNKPGDSVGRLIIKFQAIVEDEIIDLATKSRTMGMKALLAAIADVREIPLKHIKEDPPKLITDEGKIGKGITKEQHKKFIEDRESADDDD